MDSCKKDNKFSIIVPYYNTNLIFTKFCFKSIFQQDLALIQEVIVVNDGSSEKHKNELIKLVDELNKDKKIIKLIHQNNLGSAEARKTGFNNSTGEIIMFVDSDDYLCNKNCLFILNNLFKNNQDIDLINFQCVSIKNEKEKIKLFNKNKQNKIKKVFNLNWYFNENLKPKGSPLTFWIYAYRKCILNDSILWNTLNLPFEDFYFNSALLGKKIKGIVINDILYAYRKHNNDERVTISCKNLNIRDKIEIFSKWFTTFSNWQISTSQDSKDYWISIFIENALSSIGFRKLIKLTNDLNLASCSIEDIKEFCKKYKFYSGFRRICMIMCVKFPIFDFLIPKMRKWINALM